MRRAMARAALLRIARGLYLLFTLLLAPGMAQAAPCTYPAGGGTAYGNASVSGSKEITLTPNAVGQAGAWWATNPISLWQNADFTFLAYLGSNVDGADGITLTFRNPASKTLGGGGGWLGYGEPDEAKAILQSVALELDTYAQSYPDPFEDHIAFNANGSNQHNLVSAIPLPITLDDAADHTVRFVWTAATKTVTVYIDGAQYYSGVIDIASYTGTNRPIWGFTAGTGGATNLHKVCLQTLPPAPGALVADLSLAKTASSNAPTYQTDFAYTLTLSSAALSDGTVSSVTVQDLLPAGVTFVSASGTGTYNSGTGAWSVSNLAPGGTAGLTITAKATAAVGTSVTNIAQITASSLGDPDSTPNNGVTTEDDYASVAITVGANTISCGTGSTATGSGYAASGTSSYVGQIFWLDWSCGGTSLFNKGATVNKSWTVGDGLTITGQLTGITEDIRPYTVGSNASDTLQLRHAGLNPIGLRNNTNGQDPSFNLALSAALGGSPMAMRWVLGDAEDAGSGESIVATTDGTAWQSVESSGSITASAASNSVTISDPANAGGGTAVMETTATNLALSTTLNSAVGTAAAFGILTPYDFSDAPLTGTSYGSAHHRTLPGLGLGAAVTTEFAAYDSPGATADSDDAVTVPTLLRSHPGTIGVAVRGSGKLSAWIDYNGDGDFADAGEQIASDAVDGGSGDSDGAANGTIALAVTPPATANTAPTIGRFRYSSTSSTASSGLAAYGEVEDYQITVNNPSLATSKTSQVLNDPVRGSTNPLLIPGARVRYCVEITNTGTIAAENVIATDSLSANLDYGAGTLKSGASCATATTAEDDDATGSDETDPFGASISGSTITATAASLAVGATFALTYEATIK